MPIDDAFWIVLPDDLSSLSIGQLFQQVFPRGESLQASFRERLGLEANPDLADMYESIVDIVARRQAGLCTVWVYRNHGQPLGDSTAVRQLKCEEDRGLLLVDLVLEQRFSPIEYAVTRGEFSDADEALRWLQSRAVLYFLDGQDYILPIEPINETDVGLLSIAQSLGESGDIEPSNESGLFEITEQGHETVHQMIAEAENVIDRYEVFADVLYDPETGECEFGTGRGEDMRIPVYEAEGVEPLQAVFHVELYDGTLVRLEDDWREVIHEREFFEVLLMPVVDRPLLDYDVLEKIAEAGFVLMDEQTQEASQEARNRELRRAMERN